MLYVGMAIILLGFIGLIGIVCLVDHHMDYKG
jgi:hypothetical protein